jgi:hypothetical protein
MSAERREWYRKYMDKRRAANPDKAYRQNLAMNLKRLYGMSLEEYESRAAGQRGLCLICSSPPTNRIMGRRPRIDQRLSTARLVVDHNHISGNVRGLLCHRCNTVVGFVESQGGLNEDLIQRLKVYIETDGEGMLSVKEPVRH